jgi:hypothetical protein
MSLLQTLPAMPPSNYIVLLISTSPFSHARSEHILIQVSAQRLEFKESVNVIISSTLRSTDPHHDEQLAVVATLIHFQQEKHSCARCICLCSPHRAWPKRRRRIEDHIAYGLSD